MIVKKFDVCLMNPPYDRSLHLKFLEKTIALSDKVVSVQPVRWLQDQTQKGRKTSDYNKYKESISDHIKELEVYNAEKAKSTFGILATMDLAVYVCDDEGGFDYESFFNNPILDRVQEFIKDNNCTIDKSKKDGWRVRIPMVVSGKGVGSGKRAPRLSDLGKLLVFKDGERDGKPWYKHFNTNQHSKTTAEITHSIAFNTETEAENFCKSFNTEFCKYVEDHLITDVNVSTSKILWMGNAKHPRTGKTGYESEWTDADFEKFFNLTDDEKKTYHDHITKFNERLSEWNNTKKRK